MLPLRIVEFWYPNSIVVFLRSFKNALLVIEEDFALNLMIRFLFVPLFYDANIIGRAFSFLFRLSRIYLGLLAYAAVFLVFFAVAFFWFITPVAMLISLIAQFINNNDFFKITLRGFSDVSPVLLFGIALFIQRRISEPEKKIWQVKSVKDFWKATKVHRNDLVKSELLEKHEVGQFLASLELTKEEISFLLPEKFEISVDYLEEVLSLGINSKARFTTEAYFLTALIKKTPGIDKKLQKLNLRITDFEKALCFLEYKRNHWRKIYIWDEDFHTKHVRGVDRSWLGVPTYALDLVSNDLTKQALRKPFADFIGRKSVVVNVVNVLSKNQDWNCLLIGPAGSGKTTLVNFLAKIIISGDAPETLATKRLVQLDIPRLISSVEDEEELAEKIKIIFEEVEFSQNIIIFIDEIQNLGLGNAKSELNIYSLLKPYLSSGKFQFLATIENEPYAKIIEKNESFSRFFHKVEITPATFDETLEIVLERTVELARYGKIHVTYLAIKEIVLLSEKLVQNRVLPDSAMFILNECEERAVNNLITVDSVKEVFSQIVNVSG